MRVIVIGGTGTIGSAVVKRLSTRHDGGGGRHKKGAFQADLASLDSTTSLFKATALVMPWSAPPGLPSLRAWMI